MASLALAQAIELRNGPIAGGCLRAEHFSRQAVEQGAFLGLVVKRCCADDVKILLAKSLQVGYTGVSG